MGHSVASLLAPKRVQAVISRVAEATAPLSMIFSFAEGGSNRSQFGGRHFFYDVFNNTREVASGSRPGTPSANVRPQKVGEVLGVFPHASENIQLLDEEIFNRRRLGGIDSELDSMGEAYITRQEMYLAQKFVNIVEFQVAAMLRGSYTYTIDGNALYHDFSGGSETVNFQIPANNKNQLNGIIAASWATTTTDIPGHIFAINAKSLELTGFPIAHAICNSATWQYLLNNTKLAAQGGTANVIFDTIKQDERGNFTARLRAIPWLTWHIIDSGLNVGSAVGGTFTKLIGTDQVSFIPDPSPLWCTYLEGSEIVTRGPAGTRGEEFGLWNYSHAIDDPSGYKMVMGFNGIPALYNPGCIFNADVTP